MKKIGFLWIDLREKYKNYKKDRSNSRRFKTFYSTTKEDKRSDLAKVIDYVLWRIFIFFSILLIIYFIKTNLYRATMIAIVGLSIYHIISIKIRNDKIIDFKNDKRKTVATQRIYKEILNKTVEEMREYIIDIFSKRGFTKIQYVNNDHKSILMKANYNQSKIMICCYMYKNDFDVELKELKEFLCQLTQHDIKKGVFITTSDFTQDCYNYLDKLNESYRMILINKDKLLNVIQLNDMFPTEEEIDEIIENQISKRNRNWTKYKSEAFSTKKIKGYLLLSIYLTITAFYIPYTVYYMIMASICLFLALITIIFYFRDKNHQEEDWKKTEDIFQGL
ncbi:restriction endonuclease [Natronincola ferrireducens]|uniref:Restriction endonuclease n=1 Tax=Natronincola ferrireducens TaxID=393762 RepID=A0A1G9BKF1_9FIRM|nr:restriction endonuclease [Natronincola ferrireducens]SDK39998.1 Restriction endonuclease [Natronincola ferrireducens]